MESKKHSAMRDPSGERSRICVDDSKKLRDHAESRLNSGFATCVPTNDEQPVETVVAHGSRIKPEHLTVVQVADLLRCHVATTRRHCESGKYAGAVKETINGGEGWLIPVRSLPSAAQAAYAKQFAVTLAAKTGVKAVALSLPPEPEPEKEYSLLWDRYDRKDSNFKRMAEEALAALQAYLDVKETGVSVGFAEKAIAASHGVSRSTIRRYLDFTKNHPRQHWLPLLCPQYHGGRARAEFTQAAYDFILALKIQSPSTNLRVLIRAAVKEGASKGWVLPSEDTIAKRLKEEPAWIFNGKSALERSFPTVERDYASLGLHEMWDSDGRKADVWCRWPDGTVNRPFVIAIREARTRRVLSIRICHAPDAEAVLGAYGSALSRANAVPRYFHLDNGREYANKAFTGQQKTRYRFKYNTEEAKGILTAMDVKVHWAKPGMGRAKAIESWWNVIAKNCDQSPCFVGAYCGKDVLSKPEEFDKKNAVPVEAYKDKLIEVVMEYEKGDYGGHRGHGMNSRSVLEVYEELALTAETRKPTASEIRRCRMGVKSLKLDKKEASFKFAIEGYLPVRYWDEALADLPVSKRERPFNVHYEWGNPEAPISVYQGDEFICDAKPIDRIPFLDHDGEQVGQHMDAKRKFLKSRAKAIKALKVRGALALPDGGASTLPPMIELDSDPVIAPSSKPRILEAVVSPLQAVPDKPGVHVDTETGQEYIGEGARQAQFKDGQQRREADAEETMLQELQRKMNEQREAKARAQREGQMSDAEAEELRRKQQEKNLSVYLR